MRSEATHCCSPTEEDPCHDILEMFQIIDMLCFSAGPSRFTAEMITRGLSSSSGRECRSELNIVKTVSTTVQLSTKLNVEGAFLYLTVYTYLYISTRAKETTQFW